MWIIGKLKYLNQLKGSLIRLYAHPKKVFTIDIVVVDFLEAWDTLLFRK